MRTFLLALAVLQSACASSPSTSATEPVAEPVAEPGEKPEVAETSHQPDPSLYRLQSLHGTVTDAEGKPIAGAYLRIMRKDTGPESNPLDADGRYVLHARPENSGPLPWEFVYGAPGYEEQTKIVEGMPEEGLQVDIQLVPKAASPE